MQVLFRHFSISRKITYGLTAICAVFIIGMAYILVDFRSVAVLGENAIDKKQPIVSALIEAVQLNDDAESALHKFLLTGNKRYYTNYLESINNLSFYINSLRKQSTNDNALLDDNELLVITENIKQIKDDAKSLLKLSTNYAENYIIISGAAEQLNPLALQYLGIVNDMIAEIRESQYSSSDFDTLILLSDIRHSWTQMMSYLRIAIATRLSVDLENIYAYGEVNSQLTDKLLKKTDAIGLYETIELKKIELKYQQRVKELTNKFDDDVWRQDTKIMKTRITPSFEIITSMLKKLEKKNSNLLFKLYHQLDDKLQFANFIYILVILIAVLLSIMLAYMLTRNLKSRFRSLNKVTTRVRKGDFNIRADESIEDEIGKLATAFNKMLDSIDKYQKDILIEKENAEAASEAKTKFLSRMSHELRTPLNAILGFSNLSLMSLNEDDFDDLETLREHFKYIELSGQHLLSLVNEILDLSRIAADAITMDFSTQTVTPLLEECIETVKPMLQEKHLSISSDLQGAKHACVTIDPGRLKQVILNLLSNAIKYNRENGHIMVSASIHDNRILRLQVDDTGYGFRASEKQKIFEAFNRLDADDKAIDGVGIGLTISKTFIKLMHGNILVDSIPGKGTSFWVDLPIQQLLHQTNIPQHTPQTDKPTILYVEDDPLNQRLVEEIIQTHRPGCQIHIASSASSGILQAKQYKPDIVLMDINLPGMDGQEVMQILRHDSYFTSVPFIAISADAIRDNIEQRLQAGFDHYIVKPVSVEEILHTLDQYLPLVDNDTENDTKLNYSAS